MEKKRLDEIIEQKHQFFAQISDKIWQYAEMRFEETQSADLLCEVLASEGFAVEKGIEKVLAQHFFD